MSHTLTVHNKPRNSEENIGRRRSEAKSTFKLLDLESTLDLHLVRT